MAGIIQTPESSIREVSSNTILTSNDRLVLVDASSGPRIITLPLAELCAGLQLKIKKIDPSLNTVTVQRQGADTIEGETTKVLTAQYATIILESIHTSTYPNIWGLLNGNILGSVTGIITAAPTSSGCGIVPLGAVLATFPNLTGAYVCTATTTPDINGYVLCQGQTIVTNDDGITGVIPPIHNSVFLMGNTVAGTAAEGSNSRTLTTTELPAHDHNMNHTHGIFISDNQNGYHNHTYSGISSINSIDHTHTYSGTSQVQTVFHQHDASHNHTTSITAEGDHTHTQARVLGDGSGWGPTTPPGAYYTLSRLSSDPAGGHNHAVTVNTKTFDTGTEGSYHDHGYTGTTTNQSVTHTHTHSGTTDNELGQNHTHLVNITALTQNTSSTGSGSAFDIRPLYLSAVYIMRVL